MAARGTPTAVRPSNQKARGRSGRVVATLQPMAYFGEYGGQPPRGVGHCHSLKALDSLTPPFVYIFEPKTQEKPAKKNEHVVMQLLWFLLYIGSFIITALPFFKEPIFIHWRLLGFNICIHYNDYIASPIISPIPKALAAVLFPSTLQWKDEHRICCFFWQMNQSLATGFFLFRE